MGPRFKVSSDKLVKPGIEPATPGLQGKRFIHYTTAAPNIVLKTKTCPPSIYTIDHPDSTVSNFMEKSIGLKKGYTSVYWTSCENLLMQMCRSVS